MHTGEEAVAGGGSKVIAKFLVPLQIPDEFMVDEDMRNTLAMYKNLQAEFQACHQNVEVLR